MFRVIATAALALTVLGGTAFADPIEGMWKRPAAEGGTLEKITQCGARYCVTVASGENSGKSAGWMAPAGGGKYSGEIKDIDANKTYKGKGEVKGNSLVMSGCVLFGIVCKSETWTRQ